MYCSLKAFGRASVEKWIFIFLVLKLDNCLSQLNSNWHGHVSQFDPKRLNIFKFPFSTYLPWWLMVFHDMLQPLLYFYMFLLVSCILSVVYGVKAIFVVCRIF